MTYLLLSILITCLLFVILKKFDTHKIDNLQAIIINYFVAFSVGIIVFGDDTAPGSVPTKPWFAGAFTIGFLFISLFNLLAFTIQKVGLSIVSVASKMSVVIPILFGVFAYGEQMGWLKSIGTVTALSAVYLTSQSNTDTTIDKNYIFLPVLLFFGSGILDTTLKYVESNFVPADELPLYTATIFLLAACLGMVFLLIKSFFYPVVFAFKNLIAGIILGVPNYFSIYFLLKALQTKGLESSTLFTINNVSVVVLSTVLGIFLFKEQLSRINRTGIALAIVAILLIFFAV